MASHGNDPSRYLSNGSYTLPTITETITTERPRLYSKDGLLGKWQRWGEQVPTKSMEPSLTSLSKKCMLPSMVDRLMTENVDRSVRGVGMPSPDLLSDRHRSLRRADAQRARLSSYLEPRFPQNQAWTYIGRSGGCSPGPKTFLEEFPPSISNHAYGWESSRAYRNNGVDKMLTKSTLAPCRRRPYRPLPSEDPSKKLPASLYADYLADPGVMGPQKGTNDPLICRCCEDINRINLYNQRLGRSTHYPLLPTLPPVDSARAGRRHGRRKEGDAMRESDSDIYNTGF